MCHKNNKKCLAPFVAFYKGVRDGAKLLYSERLAG